MSDFVFNVQSAAQPFASEHSLQQLIANMLAGMSAYERLLGGNPQFRSSVSPWDMDVVIGHEQIKLGVFIAQLGRGEYRDESEYFLSLALMSPEWEGVNDETLEKYLDITDLYPAFDQDPGFEVIAQARSDACLCALAGFILVSLRRSISYDTSTLGFLNNKQLYNLDHISSETHASEISERYQRLVFESLNVRNFWLIKETAFPKLLFGMDIEDQISRFDTTALSLLFTRLGALNKASEVWGTARAGFPLEIIKPKGESRLTMDSYTDNRTFKGYDGRSRVFEEHVWVDGGNRIHFYRDAENYTIEIGYIGTHLPTHRY